MDNIHFEKNVITYKNYKYDCRPKGPCTDCALQRPPRFQHETPQFFLSLQNIWFLGEKFNEHI